MRRPGWLIWPSAAGPWDSPPALREETAVIPRSFSRVFENYNDLQKQQGFDLSRYCGMEVKAVSTYRVLDSDLGDEVLAVLYVCVNEVIGGDIHSRRWTALCAGSNISHKKMSCSEEQLIFTAAGDQPSTSMTTPEPTVRPPSRIAKRRPFSIAMGVISSTFMSTLSPGMHISVPSGRVMMPVTSVVRK